MQLGDLVLFLYTGLAGVPHPQHPLPDDSGQDVDHQADEPGTGWVEGVDQGQDGGNVQMKLSRPFLTYPALSGCHQDSA